MLTLALAGAALRAQPKAEDESSQLVEEGRDDLKRAKLDDAARALDQAIALNPRRVEAYVLRAAVHLAVKQYAAGTALVRRARALDPQNEDVLAMLGTLLVLDGKYDEGVPLLEGVVARAPGRYEAHVLLGKHDAQVGDWKRAIAEYEAYLKTRPSSLAGDDDAYRIDLADAYLRDGQARRAATLFDDAVRARPRDVRARLGQAWAAAALDCRRARVLLDALRDEAGRHPEIGLVDGRCALALGAVDDAIASARRYVASAPRAAAGHGLLGDALLEKNDVAGAKDELVRARDMEPGSRRWAVKLGEALRRTGDTGGALAALDRIGPPAAPDRDRAWWRELALSLVADGKLDVAVDRVGPVAPALGDPIVFAALGEAELARGRAPAAIDWLEQAEQAGGTPRSKALLARALETDGVAKLGAGDLAGADGELARASGIAGASPTVWRNLGVVRLAAVHAADAVAPLEKATKLAPDAVSWMLLARSRAASGAPGPAREAYAKAQAIAKDADAVAVALDAAAFEMESGEPAAAVTALEKVKAGDARLEAALETARHAAALAALRAGAGGRAVQLLEAAGKDAAGDEQRAVACDLAIATVAAGDRDAALRRLRALGSAPCPFPAPADTQAVPISIALNEGLRPHGAAKALPRLAKLQRGSSGAARVLLATATRVLALAAADEAYRAGQNAAAEKYLATARTAETHAGADELAHNQAVIDIAAGRLDAAIAALEKLGNRPDSLLDLGIAYDKHGDGAKALDAWRRARRAGSKWPELGAWIDGLERIYGPEAAP